MNKTWGKHLIIDAYGIQYKKLRNQKSIRALLKDLPKKFKMRPLGKEAVKKSLRIFIRIGACRDL